MNRDHGLPERCNHLARDEYLLLLEFIISIRTLCFCPSGMVPFDGVSGIGGAVPFDGVGGIGGAVPIDGMGGIGDGVMSSVVWSGSRRWGCWVG